MTTTDASVAMRVRGDFRSPIGSKRYRFWG